MWFDLPATPVTEEIKRDLILLKNRKYLGPKSFFKGNDSKKLPTYFHVRAGAFSAAFRVLMSACVDQIGTVVSGPTDKASELTRRERKEHMMDELVGDGEFTVRVSSVACLRCALMRSLACAQSYARRKFLEIQHQKASGGRKQYKDQRKRRLQGQNKKH
jgi:hypothetical protein